VIRPPAALAHAAGHAWEQLALPAAARRAHLLLSPANLAPLAYSRNVVVIHDSAPFRDAAWYGRVYGSWHRALLPRIARRAELVITPSGFVREELAELFRMRIDRFRAIAPGVDSRFAEPGDPAPVLRRLGLDERPYVLALSTDSPRKNLPLLDAIAPEIGRTGLDIVIAGSTRPYMPSGTEHPAARRLGYIADDDLPALYAGAAVFAMPSFYEGYGLPCVEAMAAGTPVVAAARAALPEACGGAALLVDPEDPDAFAAALLEAAGHARERLVAAGRERARRLTWRETAEEVDSALEPLLATGRRR
jgi:glycosyltransferase involved in cell wall biosynthesis